MNRVLASFLLSFIFVFLALPSQASSIKKGFEALIIKDYFKANKMLNKGMKYNPSAASYGLSILYSRDNNPYFNKDSALHYALFADSTWDSAKDKKKEKWKIYGWTRTSIDSLKILVSSIFFIEAKQINSIAHYSDFIVNHPWSKEFNRAIQIRDSLAFFEVVAINSSDAYNLFIVTYPNSVYVDIAQENFYDAEYFELTINDSLPSYLQFIDEHPDSPLRTEAEKRVFRMVTASNTVEAFELFVLGYSNYDFNTEGWRRFYQVYLFDYSKSRMTDFLVKYPDNPIREEIVHDLLLCDSLFLPFNSNGNYGYMNSNGTPVIDAVYDYAGAFTEGLAPVSQNGTYGFINKKGKVVIPIIYNGVSEFHFGRSIVEKDGKFGMLDRKNRILLENEYEDVGLPKNNLIYFFQNDKYGYVDLNGNEIIPATFDEAYDFVGDYAMVEVDGLKAMINKRGEYMIAPQFDKLTQISDTLYLCTLNGRKGVVSENGTFVIAPKYDQIGKFKDGLALVSRSDTIEYINMSGEVVLSKNFRTFPNFLLKGEFENESAIIFRKNKYGRINRQGDVITDVIYQNLGVGAKFIPFQKQDNWGLMSLSNRVLISPLYESIDLTHNGFVIAGLHDSLGVLDVDGNIIIPFSFTLIDHLKDDLFIVRVGNFLGLYSGKEAVTEVKYEQIDLFKDNFVYLVKDGELEYYDILGKKLIKLTRE